MGDLRVLVDARDLRVGSAQSGIATYVRGLLSALPGVEGIAVSALALDGTRLPERVGTVRMRRRADARRRGYMEHSARVSLDLARRSDVDVFHNPSFHPPLRVRVPWVQTLFDVIPLIDDSPDLAALRRWWQRFGPRYRRADAVIAISAHAAETGIAALGLDRRRVHVIHLAAAPAFTADGPAAEADAPYVLVVSEFSQRKRFELAFEVIARLADAGYPHRLRVAGPVRDDSRQTFDALLARAPRPDRIDVLGHVDDLPALYRGAAVVVVPSRAEGFGLPALEAMASGVPVVAFANSSLVEVVAGGGVLVDDGDVAAMTAAVRSLLDSEGHRTDVVGRGLERAATFSWHRCATETAAVYRSITG